LYYKKLKRNEVKNMSVILDGFEKAGHYYAKIWPFLLIVIAVVIVVAYFYNRSLGK